MPPEAQSTSQARRSARKAKSSPKTRGTAPSMPARTRISLGRETEQTFQEPMSPEDAVQQARAAAAEGLRQEKQKVLSAWLEIHTADNTEDYATVISSFIAALGRVGTTFVIDTNAHSVGVALLRRIVRMLQEFAAFKETHSIQVGVWDSEQPKWSDWLHERQSRMSRVELPLGFGSREEKYGLDFYGRRLITYVWDVLVKMQAFVDLWQVRRYVDPQDATDPEWAAYLRAFCTVSDAMRAFDSIHKEPPGPEEPWADPVYQSACRPPKQPGKIGLVPILMSERRDWIEARKQKAVPARDSAQASTSVSSKREASSVDGGPDDTTPSQRREVCLSPPPIAESGKRTGKRPAQNDGAVTTAAGQETLRNLQREEVSTTDSVLKAALADHIQTKDDEERGRRKARVNSGPQNLQQEQSRLQSGLVPHTMHSRKTLDYSDHKSSDADSWFPQNSKPTAKATAADDSLDLAESQTLPGSLPDPAPRRLSVSSSGSALIPLSPKLGSDVRDLAEPEQYLFEPMMARLQQQEALSARLNRTEEKAPLDKERSTFG